MTDEDLEQLKRAGLHRKATEVDNRGGYAAAAHDEAPNRRRTRASLLAAVAVTVVVGGVSLADRMGSEPGSTQAAGPTIGAATSQPTDDPAQVAPSGWRVESYNGVQLQVPRSWGWGGVPMNDPGDGRLLSCGQGAFAFPGEDGRTHFAENVDMPYVGRSGYYMTDVCMSGVAPPLPKHPWVWLGSPVDPSTVDLANDYVQKTVEVNDVRVTVGDDHPRRLATILSSLQRVDVDANGCAASTKLPTEARGFDELKAVDTVSVCGYRRIDDHGLALGYSTQITGSRADRVLDAIKSTPPSVLRCAADSLPTSDRVVLRFHSDDREVDVPARLDGCGGFYTGGPSVRLFTRSNVMPWVVDGIGLYLSSGQVGNAITGLYDKPAG
jgi:hypothetical protein